MSQSTHEQSMSQNDRRYYLCIDLKTFYASVECADRGLDPFTTNLVVADPDRTDKTICLAITPAMKALGIRNRCRVFEIPEGVDYIMAKPRMRRYMEVSAEIYGIYLRYVAPEDIYVYSVDECFIDATPYEALYDTDARGLAEMLMNAVYEQEHIRATCGIGTNLFLAKVALDVCAKHARDGLAFLDEVAFKEQIWTHRPITDIWNVGPGIARRLAKYGVYDLMGVCWMDQRVLYREFGVNARYLIDHAQGIEPCTIQQIHAYKPEHTSMQQGQVLPCGYSYKDALMIMHEMADMLILDLVDKHLVAGGLSLSVGYETHGTQDEPARAATSRKLARRSSSAKALMPVFDELWKSIVDPTRYVRRLVVGADNTQNEDFADLDLFSDVDAERREKDLQKCVLAVKKRFGKNALFKGISLRPRATARERNEMTGGHHA